MATAVALASAVGSQAVGAKTAEQIYAEVSPSVVLLLGRARDGNDSLGSGVVVALEKVATNCHVPQGQQDVGVASGDQELDARIHAVDWGRDVCILQVPELTAPPARMGTIQNVRIGRKVYAIGSPEGLEATLSDGLVSGFREFEYGTVIQISAPISHGSSGGGLFDEQGVLIGLTTLLSVGDAQNLNFAHPVDWIREMLASPGHSIRLSAGDAPTPPAKSPVREAPPPPPPIPADPPVYGATAALIERLSITDVRFEMVDGAATVAGTIRSHSNCTAAGLRLRASFGAGPYVSDPVVHSLVADALVLLGPYGRTTFSIADPSLSGHTENSPARGRWWVRVNVVNADDVNCR